MKSLRDMTVWDLARLLPYAVIVMFLGNALPDYLSLLETRYLLRFMKGVRSSAFIVLILVLAFIITVGIASVPVSVAVSQFGIITTSPYLAAIAQQSDAEFSESLASIREPDEYTRSEPKVTEELAAAVLAMRHGDLDQGNLHLLKATYWYGGREVLGFFGYPAFFTSIWLWLYAGSGFLLKTARRLDIGFQWFNRRFDIEKKPLQSIGLVAGALVALVYWAAVIVSRIVG